MSRIAYIFGVLNWGSRHIKDVVKASGLEPTGCDYWVGGESEVKQGSNGIV